MRGLRTGQSRGGRCEGGATYSFRSFRHAANQPTDRPTEVTSGGRTAGDVAGRSVQAAVPNRTGVGAGRGGSVRLANGSRRASPRNSITRATPL